MDEIIKDQLGQLSQACKYGDIKHALNLLQNPLIDPSKNDDIIVEACMHGYTSIVERLLQYPRVNPAAKGNMAICWAAGNGHLQIVQRLLQDRRVDPSVSNNQAIRWASQRGHTEIVNLLLQDRRVDPSVKNNTSIDYACENGYIDVVNRLLQDPRVDPSVTGNTLYSSCICGHIDVVIRLLKDPRIDNDNFFLKIFGRVPLNTVVENNHLDVAECLLQHPRIFNYFLDINEMTRIKMSNSIVFTAYLVHHGRFDYTDEDGEDGEDEFFNGIDAVIRRLLGKMDDIDIEKTIFDGLSVSNMAYFLRQARVDFTGDIKQQFEYHVRRRIKLYIEIFQQKLYENTLKRKRNV